MFQVPKPQTVPDRKGCAGFRGMVSRRSVVQAGVFGALGLSLGDMLRLEARGAQNGNQAFSATPAQGKIPAKALSVIQLHSVAGIGL